ncbi:MAG: DNA polymerase I [Rhodobacterales bacterium]|nr:DNA polymerase I [Rhodobacterales bacterium]
MAKKTLFLVDGSNHAFRVQFALPPQHASDGFPTRVLYGFTLLFQKMMRTYRPDYCVVSFDSGKTFRHEQYPAYKGHRPEMPEDLRRQWGHLSELVEGFGYRSIQVSGYEADDVLGTLAKRFAGPDLDVYLVTGDKDFCQLIDENTFVLDDSKGKILKLGDVEGKMGVTADKVIDMLGLSGDSADNIPGVPGIGPKTATKLLNEYGTLEGVLEAALDGKIKGKRGQNLVEHADNARMSAELATIALDVPIEDALEDLAPRGIQEAPLREMFDRWEFGMVARKLLPEVDVVNRDQYRAVVDDAGLVRLMADVRAAGLVGVSFRVAGKHWIGASLAWDGGVVYVPLEARAQVVFDHEHARAVVLELMADTAIKKVGYNLKQVLSFCRKAGGELASIAGDIRLLDYVLVAHRRNHNLADIAQRHLGHNLAYVPDSEPLMIADVVGFAAEPAHVALLLHERLEKRLSKGTSSIYRDIELPLMPVLEDMERQGIRLDVDHLASVRDDIKARLKDVEALCHELAGRSFKVSSPKEVGVLLFEELGLPVQKRTKTGYSTDSSVLDALREHHALPPAIIHYRQLSKLLNTYLKKLPNYVAEDGKIHTTFAQAVAATGRLSSLEPNLQNIPIRTFEGRRIRDCFVPGPGNVFLSCDYSQVELRVLAHFVGKGTLVESFNAGEDIHRRTASEVWDTPIGDVTPEQRSAAKAVNFGLLYGMSSFRLARELSISRTEAQQYIDDYFGRMPEVSEWIEESKRQCKAQGYVETLYGRRRLIPEIYAKSFSDRAAGEREAVNTRVQGTAADIIKLAMLRVSKALTGHPSQAKLLLQVHDELLLEVPAGHLEEVQQLVITEMMAAADLVVPLVVNAASGTNWNQAHG